MPVDAHLARARAAGGVVAAQPARVVARHVPLELRVELRGQRERRQHGAARRRGAADALVADRPGARLLFVGGRLVPPRGEHAEVGEDVLAGAAAEAQRRRVLEAHGVRDLRLERLDARVRRAAVVGGAADAVLARVEAEAVGEAGDVGARDWRAEALHRGKDLLVEVVVDVWRSSACRLSR